MVRSPPSGVRVFALARLHLGFLDLLGNYFAPVQGGHFTSSQVAAALQQARQWGAPAVGQSSWGPTSFAFVEGEAAVRELHTQLTWWAQSSLSPERQKLKFIITRARNQGSCIESLATMPRYSPLDFRHSALL